MRASFQDRVTRLEQRHRPRPVGLSAARRKLLTDRAVLTGDQDALQELDRHRLLICRASSGQRAAAVAAALRADQ
jgi:hypothetical protein